MWACFTLRGHKITFLGGQYVIFILAIFLCCGELWLAREQIFPQGPLIYGQEEKRRPAPVPLSADA